MTSPTTTSGVADVQRRTVTTLVLSQAIGGIGVTTGSAVATVLAAEVLGDETLAGMVSTSQILGAAVAAFLLARVMAVRGRRFGLVLGSLVGASGALLWVLGGVLDSFAVLLAGSFILGSAIAANSQSRYAATDLAEPRHRARALSVVVWATTIGAVLGPNLTGPGGSLGRMIGVPELAGPFLLSAAALLVAAGVLWARLRPDPLLLAQDQLSSRGAAPPPTANLRRAWVVVRERPSALAAIVAMTLTHSVMLTVMVMTPLHMDHGGASLRVIGFVISVHVLGMFAFSPVVGMITDRVGSAVMLASGAVILLLALTLAGTAPAGHSAQLTAGLFLLGLGWSCAVIAGSALVVDAVPLADRPGVQGAGDLVQGLCGAGSATVAGFVLGLWGYAALNIAGALLAVLVLGAALVAHVARTSGDIAKQ